MKYRLMEELNLGGIDIEVSKTSYIVPYQKEVIVLIAVLGSKGDDHFEVKQNFTASSKTEIKKFIVEAKMKVIEVLNAQ